jgi:hypothetical protein
MQVRKATRLALVLATTILAVLVFAPSVFAFDETTSTVPTWNAANCQGCHSPWPDSGVVTDPYGVHAGYTATTTKCQSCHSVHGANPAGSVLLPGATITADCNLCHDGTGGQGVYGVIQARLGVAPTSAHSTENTAVVPGGNSTTGGDSTMRFAGVGGTLTCTDCHSPHGANTVAPFQGDRVRSVWGIQNYVSTKLLKQHPGNSAATVTEYGSDWCLACHQGRNSIGPVHNHPVLGQMGFNNRGYLMPYPRTTGAGGQAGHLPMCQQCHADPRFPGTLNNDGTAQAAAYTVTTPSFGTPDARTATDNPRFQIFPHESTSTAMLIQQNDDLCLNCHPAGQLP